MAGTDAKECGIYAWMASVRASMADDPCRQLFEDQVQTHAFIFLDDYLDHVLTGPKQGPIIDLVKTPGRKKNTLYRTGVATTGAARVKSTSLLSLDGDESAHDRVPVNSFHETLLQAKERSAQVEKAHEKPNYVEVDEVPEIAISVEPELQDGPIPLQHGFTNALSEPAALFLAVERGTELSIIAEGDESPERSPANISPLSVTSNRSDLPETTPLPRHPIDAEGQPKIARSDPELQENVQCSVPSSVNTCQSISLQFPRETHPSETGGGNHTEPLPSQTNIHYPRNHETGAFTAPLPGVPAASSITTPHMISIPLNDSSPKALAHKCGATGFPMLPAPSPLRKSVRIIQEATTGSAFPSSAPALVPLSKRTSWLMKAREAKAMEGTGSVHSNSVAIGNAAIPRVSTAIKRKSEEMLDPPLLGLDWGKEQRKPKVAKSTEAGILPVIPKEAEKTDPHDLPGQGEPIAMSSVATAIPVDHLEPHLMDVDGRITRVDSTDEGSIDLFKRTVEGLGARAGKSIGKSLCGAAVAALAEARAAAEAKVAKRNKVVNLSRDPETLLDVGLSNQEVSEAWGHTEDQCRCMPAPKPERTQLILSDLSPVPVLSCEAEFSTKKVEVVDIGTQISNIGQGISTTPPSSPALKSTSNFVKPAGPVFNKPVFMPPVSKQPSIISGHPNVLSSNLPFSQFTLPVAASLGIPARLPSAGFSLHAPGTVPLSALPSQPGVSTDPLLDKCKGVPTWVPHTQGTRGTIDSQVCDVQCPSTVVADDDDDSWPLEEKLAAAEPGWRPFDFSNVDKEDTWSSMPTESQGPTRSLITEKDDDIIPLPNDADVKAETNNDDVEQEGDHVETSDAERSTMEVSEVEDTAEAVTTCLDRVNHAARGTSQVSVISTASSSQSQAGFFSHATKLVNTVLGVGKKTRPELKSLQLAAVAAKRQQEEADKKSQRLKDMETRRQVAIAKRAEEGRIRLFEEGKKSKEETEKRKHEREESTDRGPVKPPLVSTKKAEDDASKKRKLVPDTEKKPESKKLLPKDKKDLAPPSKSTVTPATKSTSQKSAKVTATALVSSAAYNTTQNALPATKPAIPEAKPFKVVTSSLKGKAKARAQEEDMGDKLPSTMIHSQMAARAKAQMQAAKLPTPEVPSESIELPEINSEYSDSEDEDRGRTFDPPDWAQSPELRQALQMQSTVNPDSIFGAVPPLRMEEMFRTRQSRFRARTSSANWTGSDRLTIEEIREYERRMGFQQARPS